MNPLLNFSGYGGASPSPYSAMSRYGQPQKIGFGSGLGGTLNPMAPSGSFGLGSDVGTKPSTMYSDINSYGMAPVGTPAVTAMDAAKAVPGAALATADAAKSGFFGADGFTLGDLGAMTEIIGSFGGLWSGLQANRLAQQAFNFERDAYRTNLENTTAAYNLSLEDRIRARYQGAGQSAADAEAYINRHRLGE